MSIEDQAAAMIRQIGSDAIAAIDERDKRIATLATEVARLREALGDLLPMTIIDPRLRDDEYVTIRAKAGLVRRVWQACYPSPSAANPDER